MTATTSMSTLTPATLTGIAARHTTATLIITVAPAASTAVVTQASQTRLGVLGKFINQERHTAIGSRSAE